MSQKTITTNASAATTAQKEPTTALPTKTDNGVRFFVVAQQYEHGLNVHMHSSQEQPLRNFFKSRFENQNVIIPMEFGIALCSVSRYGNVSWGLFKKL